MTAKELYQYAIDQATAVVVQVEPGQFELPTPDTEWKVRDLLQHMLYELAWVADIVAGRTPATVGKAYDRDLVGDDAITNWRTYKLQAEQAVEACNETAIAHLSYRDTSVRDYLWEAGNDQLIHAWDLGQAVGISVVFDELVAQALYERARIHQKELYLSGLFGVPVEVPASSNVQTKLLALLGRSEDWVENKIHRRY